MSNTQYEKKRQTRAAALALTVALHLALLALWRTALAPRPPAQDGLKGPAFEWLRLLPVAPMPARPKRPKEHGARARPHADAAASHSAPPLAIAPAPTPVPAPAPASDPFEASTTPLAPASKTEDILRQARRDIGKFDRELRAASPKQIHAPVNTPQSRLQAGIAEAAAAVPPKWYEPARIEALADQGGYGRRIYKITTFKGTYCVTYESNHAPDGLDVMANGIKPKPTTCPR
ncbi:MAG: hypothetical protein V4582_23205 [Pseudomonadota bacterium]